MASAARQVLVLGPPPISDLIAKQFHELGFEARIQAKLPSPIQNDSVFLITEMIRAFVKQAGEASLFVHPGTTPWAERAEFVGICEKEGIEVISPSSRTLSILADRLTFLAEAAQQGVPVLLVEAERGPIQSARELERLLAGGAKLPLTVRSARGSGPFGCFALTQASQLEREFPLWLEQHRLNLGEPILFVERRLEACRKISLPFCRFKSGEIEFFPMIDGSLQSRFQKVIEFCPADSVDDEVGAELQKWATRLSEFLHFVGVGSFEFSLDGDAVFLSEVSPRLDSSFHLWEQVAGTSAIAWQLAALENQDKPPQLPQKDWVFALSLRIIAEDSILHLPQPGVVREISPSRYWRVAGAVAELFVGSKAGQEIEVSLAALAFVGGLDRKRALTMARGILEESWIAGGLQTNERFLSELIAHPWVKEGIFHASFIDEEFLPSLRPPAEILLAAVDAVRQIQAISESEVWVAADRKILAEALELAKCAWVSSPDRFFQNELPGISGAIQLKDGRKVRLCAFPLSSERWQVRLGSWFIPVKKSSVKPGIPKISALVPGRVHSILVRNGGILAAHQPALIIEALGHLVPHAVPKEVVIESWKVKPEQRVRPGEDLAEFSVSSKV